MGFLKSLLSLIKEIKSNHTAAKKYVQMSADELKCLNDTQLSDAIDTVLYYYIDGEDISKLNEVQLTAVTIKNFDSEVQNGGLCQFFVNSSSEFAPYVSSSLININAMKTAKLFDNFILKNCIDLNDLESFKIKSPDKFDEQCKRYPFDDFDDNYYELYENEDLSELLITYARNNISVIFENLNIK